MDLLVLKGTWTYRKFVYYEIFATHFTVAIDLLEIETGAKNAQWQFYFTIDLGVWRRYVEDILHLSISDFVFDSFIKICKMEVSV